VLHLLGSFFHAIQGASHHLVAADHLQADPVDRIVHRRVNAFHAAAGRGRDMAQVVEDDINLGLATSINP